MNQQRYEWWNSHWNNKWLNWINSWVTHESRTKGTNDETMNESTNHWIRKPWSQALILTCQLPHASSCLPLFAFPRSVSIVTSMQAVHSYSPITSFLEYCCYQSTSEPVNDWRTPWASQPVSQSDSQPACQSASRQSASQSACNSVSQSVNQPASHV